MGDRCFSSYPRFALIGALTLLAAWAVYEKPSVLAQAGSPFPASAQHAGAPASFPCSLAVRPSFGPTVPGDAKFFATQPDADCFAWAEFIALNWPTTGSRFGSPGDLSPVQWENYVTKEALFPSNGSRPAEPLDRSSLPAACQTQTNIAARAAGKLRVLMATSKLTASVGIPQQPFPDNRPSWLGAQNGTNVWYEVLLSPDEATYIISNQFYNANRQEAYVNDGQGSVIVFPKGESSGKLVGTIELKAAWMEAPHYDPKNPGNWAHYLLAPAVVVDPSNNRCRSTTVALVGLHIIHKTENQPTWVWATFEHVDNVLGPNSTPACCNFQNINCQPRRVTVARSSCLAPGQTSPVTVSCTANTPPPYYLGADCPGPVPIQVSRTASLPDDSVKINEKAFEAITGSYPDSVFRYYQLVDVLWSTNPASDPAKPQRVPLFYLSGLTSGSGLASDTAGIVANTTLETYVQNSQCTQCHKNATIAPTSRRQPWDADFSFAFGSASPGPSSSTAPAGQKSDTPKK